MSDYISRADAIDAGRGLTQLNGRVPTDSVIFQIKALPSADAVDCTDFIDWIRKVVADEELWDLNAVGYGEIICRKLVEIGALATTEKPPYYYVPSADAEQGEWIMHGEPPWFVRECSECGTKWHHWSGDSNPNYCGHCGARMENKE